MFERVLDHLFPARCIGCNRCGEMLCSSCAPSTEPVHRQLPTLELRALARYDGTWRRAVLALKSGRRDLAVSLGIRVAALLDSDDATVVGVPTSRSRRFERGFDGGELLANVAARTHGVQSLAALRLLARDRQRGRNRAERLQAKQRFGACSTLLDGARITLLDDVCTTGATLEDAAAALRSAGAIVGRAVVIAVSGAQCS